MIEAATFIKQAQAAGLIHYCGVPCSHLTPFINYVISADDLNYISAVNEGDAIATAAGFAIAGQGAVALMQNSGLGNAVNPLTSLTHIFKLPLLIITTHRGAPGITDEPQHALMGAMTTALFDLMQIRWEGFPTETDAIAPALARALTSMQTDSRPYAFIMQKNTAAACELTQQTIPDRHQTDRLLRHVDAGNPQLTRHQVLEQLLHHTPENQSILIATTGYTSRELFALADRANHIYMVGSMGCASALGLGLARARPDIRIVVIDGDGAALMRMGNLATVGSYGPDNLIHLLLDNGVHDSTGAQATVSANVRFADIAHACGYGMAISGSRLDVLGQVFEPTGVKGARFAHIRTLAGTVDPLPRPAVSPAAVLDRLRQQFAFGRLT